MTYLPISLAEAKTFTGVAVNTSFYSQPMGVRTWATYSALAPPTVVGTKKVQARDSGNSDFKCVFRRKMDNCCHAVLPLIYTLETTQTPLSSKTNIFLEIPFLCP